MSKDESASSTLGKRFHEAVEHAASEVAKAVQELIREPDGVDLLSPEGERMLAFCLYDEARNAVEAGARLALTDERLRASIASAKQRAAGRKSGAVRAERGTKYRFLQWAVALNGVNPRLSKNEVARRFAEANPGTSVATLRRYLADLEIEYKD